MNRVLIGATHSGAGKTTVTLGIMHALAQRGLRVQPFKVGPDYIDTSWHRAAAGYPSYNLDPFMLSPTLLQGLFSQQATQADISIIEGVMGLYDGLGTQPDYCSSADVARQLKCPVILVVDGKAVSTSLAATVQGFQQFAHRLDINIAGIIINRVNSSNHYQLLKQSIERYCQIPVMGRLPYSSELVLPERKLGLISCLQDQDMADYWQRLTHNVEKYIDLDKLLALSISEPLPTQPLNLTRYPDLSGITIALAYDEAFHFYYQANLDLLRQLGAELIEFSPLHDQQLPTCQAIYIGGGFPELFSAQLAANQTMCQQLRQAHQRAIPIYAECGGLMYLADYLIDDNGQKQPMLGILPGYSQMTKRLQHFGYAEALVNRDCLIGRQGDMLRGHEFHHSQFFTDMPPHLTLTKIRDGKTIASWQGGYQVGHCFASYLHLHFYQTPEILHCWLGEK